MATDGVKAGYYADFRGLEGLRKSARADDPAALRQVARQFESLFTSMMLKSMREAKLGDGLGDSQETDLYQGMYDQQLSLQLSQGKGIGLADLLVQQLTRGSAAHAAPATGAAPASTPAGLPVTQPAAPAVAAAPLAAESPQASTRTGANTTSDARTRFIESIGPAAERAARQLGVAPEAVIAQAALETGWGRHLPADNGFNLYGIKAGGAWSGAASTAMTTEFSNGSAAPVAQPFRSYGSLEAGMTDYVKLLQGNPRYQGALGTGSDVSAFASALQRGGYATDPAYAQKVSAVAAQVRALRTAAPAAPQAADLQFVTGQPTSGGGVLT